MKTGNCMICEGNVYILNCHYQCQNCGYTMDWEEGQEVGQVDHKEREKINVIFIIENSCDPHYYNDLSKFLLDNKITNT